MHFNAKFKLYRMCKKIEYCLKKSRRAENTDALKFSSNCNKKHDECFLRLTQSFNVTFYL